MTNERNALETIAAIRRELVAMKRSFDDHPTDPRYVIIQRGDLDPIWATLVELLNGAEPVEPPADSTPLERAFSEEPARSITEAALRKIAEPTRECWLCHDTDPVNQSLCREKNGTGCGTMRDKSTGDIVTPNREVPHGKT
jgi:hypothetical protein